MLARMNRLISYLAEPDIDEQALLADRFDLIILAGNSLPLLAQYCSKRLDEKIAPQLLISGGKGHGTSRLVDNINQQSILSEDEYTPLDSEASLLGKIVVKSRKYVYGELLLEEKSRNTGENAKFSLELLQSTQKEKQRVLLLQDPMMLRRTKLTFQKEFPVEKYSFYGFTPYIPSLVNLKEPLQFQDSQLNGLWEKDYLVSLIMGEIKRLYDTKEGYGPKGRGFLPHVDLPAEVIADYQELQEKVTSFR